MKISTAQVITATGHNSLQMDTPLVTSIMRTLFHHRACLRSPPTFRQSRYARPLSTTPPLSRRGEDTPRPIAWQPRTLNLYLDKSSEFSRYPLVTASDLSHSPDRPRRVKMYARDFIDDSLYNPHYGYFSKSATIFSPGEPFDFPSIADDLEFNKLLGERYTAFEDNLDKEEGVNDVRQLWHTPTELFQPYYGAAIARYLVANYKLSVYPYHDLVIYEMGAGNGTLMTNILNHIRHVDPDVYERTRYRIIEISPALAAKQTANIEAHGHGGHVELVNKSVFEWDTYEPSPCYFLALEVFDNFAHDMLRYDLATGRPLQGMVLIDNEGEFHEFYVPELDPVVSEFLALQKLTQRKDREEQSPLQAITHNIVQPAKDLARKLRSQIPFLPNLSDPHFPPTNLLRFFKLLHTHFPAHRLLTSDFHSLPNAIPGTNAPVVQTRYKRETVAVSTIYVHQGYFDILFPTDFQLVEGMYRAVTGKLTRVMGHGEFIGRWCVDEEVRTRRSA